MVFSCVGLGAVLLLCLFPVLTSGDPAHPLLERLAWLSQTVVAVIAIPTAFLVVRQIREIKWTLRAESFQATAVGIQEIARLCLVNPKGYAGLKSTRPPKVQTELLGEAILDIMDTELLRAARFDDQWLRSLPTLEPWFWDLFQELPGLCTSLEHRKQWYSNDLYALRKRAERPADGSIAKTRNPKRNG